MLQKPNGAETSTSQGNTDTCLLEHYLQIQDVIISVKTIKMQQWSCIHWIEMSLQWVSASGSDRSRVLQKNVTEDTAEHPGIFRPLSAPRLACYGLHVSQCIEQLSRGFSSASLFPALPSWWMSVRFYRTWIDVLPIFKNALKQPIANALTPCSVQQQPATQQTKREQSPILYSTCIELLTYAMNRVFPRNSFE